MDMITATNLFRRPGKGLALLTSILVLIWGGCEQKADDHHAFGKVKDVTEDLYHRLKAGMFEPGTDPFVCEIVEIPRVVSISNFFRMKPLMRLKKVPREIVRISWERGTFQVQADDLGRVVIYMDEEVLFSHVQIATLKALGLSVQFREVTQHPFR